MTRAPRPAVVGLALAVTALSCRRAPAPLRVAAAADLSRALPELGALFEQRTGHRVSFTFGSSGLLSRQIAEGAPFGVFLSASTGYVRGIGCRQERVFARGALSTVPRTALADLVGRKKIAIANPEHAPYGAAAKAALIKAGLYAQLESKLVFGDNVQHALQLYRTGNVDAAIVARSLVIDEPHTDVDLTLYAPLEQVGVLCQPQPFAQEFAELLASPEAAQLLARHGFLAASP